MISLLTLTARESTLVVRFKVDPRTVKIKTFLMTADPYHRYSNESERDIYDDFKLR